MGSFSTLIKKIPVYLLAGFLFLNAGVELTQFDMVTEMVMELGFPAWLVYWLIVTKTIGGIAIAQSYNTRVREWAIVGFSLNVLLAFFAHLNTDTSALMPIVGWVLITATVLTIKK